MRTDQKIVCLKVWLSIFLSILWLVGAAIFGVLLWLRLDFWTNEYLEVDSSLHNYLVLIYVALSAGALIVASSILGLIGGCYKKKWLLVIYLTSICVSILLTVGAVVYGVIYRHELDKIVRDNNILKEMQGKYSSQESRFRRAFDEMQKTLECCGANGPEDWNNSLWKNGLPVLAGAGSTKDFRVPATCCVDFQKEHRNDQLCEYKIPGIGSSSITDYVDNDGVWQGGCQKELEEFINNYVVVIIAIGAAFFVLMLINLIIVSCYIHLLNSLYVPQPDDIVYDMAHNQEKSPYPSRGDYREYYH